MALVDYRARSDAMAFDPEQLALRPFLWPEKLLIPAKSEPQIILSSASFPGDTPPMCVPDDFDSTGITKPILIFIFPG